MRISDWSSDVCSSDLAAERPEQKNSIAARKISARRAVIGHEHRVADEHHVADHISNTSWRMTGNMEHGNWQFANCETVAIGPETIEIRAITAKFGSGVEDVAEHSLNVPDMLADRDRAAEQDRKSTRLNSSH